ncbi:hypothetical protein BJ878DRAFT_575135 [Calycina marina]|uniref:BZIP transcription factor n=1 Tax=Calycina marina TaxID=1763456 RepID=A0A9P7Z4H2_9HELO|nr:hypothetical protein BJ878DRAFT_575135 [Calycina marina]
MPGEKRALSEDVDAPSPDPSTDAGKKRRTTGTASARGVANLTPEQLAKKRANDREAQRAIRERTKNQIESLEQKIRELTSQQPYQELQNVMRQKELVENENADMKKRLASAMSLLQPILEQPGFETLPYAAPPTPNFMQQQQQQQQRPSPLSNPAMPGMNAMPTPASTTSPGANGHQWQDHRAYAHSQQMKQSQQLDQQRYNLEHHLDMGPEKLGLEFLLDGYKVPNGSSETPGPSSFQQFSGAQERGSPIHNRSSSVTSSNTNYHGGEIGHLGHSAPIRNSPPTCPLDSLLLDFLIERQQQAADGVATPRLVGPAYPSVSSLLNPSRGLHAHPLSKVFTDILGTFPDLSTLPEKVAVLYIMFLLMRWQIAPTQENYDRLPEWMTPRPSQIFTPHPAWIDHLPFPKMRDRLVGEYNPKDYLFDNFFIPFTGTLSVNWPYEPTDTLLSSPENDELMINPVFERHLRRLDNWSLGPLFVKTFPGLADTYRVKLEGDRRA